MWFDVRDSHAFTAARHAAITPGHGLNVPLHTLGDRWFELPPVQSMGEWQWVVEDEAQQEALASAIRDRFGGPCPYPVHVIVWAKELAALTAAGAVVGGPFKAAPLWRPSPCLAGVIDAIEASLTELGVPQPWEAVDVGCGSGRDAAFLASRGCWRVTLVDQSPALLAKAVSLCEQYGCSSEEPVAVFRPRVLQGDVTDARACEAMVAGAPFHLVHVARFLHKPLLPTLAGWVAPSGFVVYMSFADGAQTVGKCTPKNPKHLVFPGEMAAAFGPAAAFLSPPLRDTLIPIEDGRPVCNFVAQKLPDTGK